MSHKEQMGLRVVLLGSLVPALWAAVRARNPVSRQSSASFPASPRACQLHGRAWPRATTESPGRSYPQRERGIALRKGRLTAVDSSDARRLRLLLRSATLADLAPGIAGIDTMALQHDETSKPLYLTIMPARGRDVPSRGRPGALVFISDPATEPASRMPLLSRLFGLTPAECRLAALLLQNVELRAAAQHMHVTTGTARFMLKSIFYKTHCHRQAELIRLVSMIPGIPPQPKSSSTKPDEADPNAKLDAPGAAS